MTTLTTVTTATPADTEAVGHLLALAFDEPVTRWLVPDPARHQPVMTGLFTLMATDALTRGGWIDLLSGDDGQPAAAALWFDHSSLEGAPASEPDPRLDEVFGPDIHRWRTLDDLMTRHHLAGPHHYLFAIGVHPDRQGTGLGGQLLIHGHERLDDLPAYLEATSPASRRLYARLGYQDLDQLQIPGGPTLWRMWHAPSETDG